MLILELTRYFLLANFVNSLRSHGVTISGAMSSNFPPMKKTIYSAIFKTIKKSPVEYGFIALSLIVISAVIGPKIAQIAYAEAEEINQTIQIETEWKVAQLNNDVLPHGSLPKSERAAPREVSKMTVTAYNSVPWQTDDTPCIGAQGTDICAIYASGENVCAANFVPLGTILHVEGLGDCTVRDRMNARYHYRVDWYMGMDIDGARQIGATQKTVSKYNS